MRYLPKGLLVALLFVVAGVIFGTGSASATVLCKSQPASHLCSPEDVYGTGTQISAHNTTQIVISTAHEGEYFHCETLNYSGTVANPGSESKSTEIANSKYEFGACTFPIVEQYWSGGWVDWSSGTHNGFLQSGSVVVFNLYGVKCGYKVAAAMVEGGSSPKLQFNEYPMTHVSGNSPLCVELKMSGTLAVSTPSPLNVESAPEPPPVSTLCKSQPASHVCPAADIYGAKTPFAAHLATGKTIKFYTYGGETTMSCSGGAISGSVSAAGGETEAARLSEVQHTYSGCTPAGTPVSAGEMTVNWNSGTDNGSVREKGGISQWVLFGITCTYEITGGEIKGGTGATLVYSGTPVVKVTGGFLCPSKLKVDATYEIESPAPLYVEL